MLWNELSYVDQRKIIEKVIVLVEQEDNHELQDGLIAAVHELETWSNFPCAEIESSDDYVMIADAQDPTY